jgi:hypothetical protein
VDKSVARPDDGVHSFFASAAQKIGEAVLDAPFIKSLRKLFAPRHRERRFKLPTLIWLGIYGAANASLASMKVILDHACEAVEGKGNLPLRLRTLTESGWSRAKDRLPLRLLRGFWHHWVELARLAAGTKALYHGMRLVALDKKTITVPEALWPTFRSHRGSRGAGPAQAELMVAYDVAIRVPLDLTLARVRQNERRMAPYLLGRLPAASLLLIDCGFYGLPLFRDARAAGHHFLTKMAKSGSPKVLERFTWKDGLFLIADKHGQTMVVRIITAQRRGFRPVRLVTSLLDPEAFPRKEIIELYHERWHIETFFRELQEELDFQHWHTRTLHGLWVELLFSMIYVTVVRAHMAESVRHKPTLPGHLSFGAGADACIRSWCRIPKCVPERVQPIRRELIEELGTLRIDIRPGRLFERNTQKRRAKSRAKKLEALKAKQLAA